jgi:hypothetical protein
MPSHRTGPSVSGKGVLPEFWFATRFLEIPYAYHKENRANTGYNCVIQVQTGPDDRTETREFVLDGLFFWLLDLFVFYLGMFSRVNKPPIYQSTSSIEYVLDCTPWFSGRGAPSLT